MGADPEICQQPLKGESAVSPQKLRGKTKVGFHQRESIVFRNVGLGVRVLIKPKQPPPLVKSIENGAAVTTTAKRRVHPIAFPAAVAELQGLKGGV